MAERRRRGAVPDGTALLEEQVERINRFPDQNPNPVMRVSDEGVLMYANVASEPIVRAIDARVGEALEPALLERLLRAAADPARPPVEVVSDHRTYAVWAVPVPEFGFSNLYGSDVTGEKVVARFPDQNPNPVFRVTEDRRVLYANEASLPVVRSLGIAVGDTVGPELFERIRQSTSDPAAPRFEVQGDDARWYVLTPVAVPEFGFINVYGTDVTGEKVVARFPDDNPNPVLRVTPDGRLAYANAASGPIVRGIGATVGEPLPHELGERVLAAADERSFQTLEISGEGRTFLLKPVWIREFGFINVYGTDVTAARELEKAHRENEALLLNILPEPIARRLREGERVIADRFEDVTLLFADIVGFTQMSSGLPANELVEILNRVFSAFDGLVARYGLEKIKTIGDAYMVVGGLPEQMEDHTARVADMALELRDEITRITSTGGAEIHFRVGINVGPVVAGVIGVTKFIYDVWGDTVNTASRMESHGIPDRIHVTRAVYERLQRHYAFESRGLIEVKGKGPMETWFLLGRLDEPDTAVGAASRGVASA